MTKPKIDRSTDRIDLYTLYEMQNLARKHDVSICDENKRRLNKPEMFNRLDQLGLLPY